MGRMLAQFKWKLCSMKVGSGSIREMPRIAVDSRSLVGLLYARESCTLVVRFGHGAKRACKLPLLAENRSASMWAVCLPNVLEGRLFDSQVGSPCEMPLVAVECLQDSWHG